MHKSTKDNDIEIVIPVRNESRRIESQILNLKENFSLVFLDGGSTDGTIDIIKKHNCTVYLRKDPYSGSKYGLQADELAQSIFDAQNGTSWCIAFYINNVSSAKYILRLWADEYIQEKNQNLIKRYLAEDSIFRGSRIDWFYGIRLRSVAVYPICFRPGEAIWDDKILHSDVLSSNPLQETQQTLIDVEHYSLCSTANNIGKWIKYTESEIIRLTVLNKSYRNIFHRYFLNMFRPIYHVRKYKSIKLFFIDLLLHIMDGLMGHIIYFEKYFLNSTEEQLKLFDRFSSDN